MLYLLLKPNVMLKLFFFNAVPVKWSDQIYLDLFPLPSQKYFMSHHTDSVKSVIHFQGENLGKKKIKTEWKMKTLMQFSFSEVSYFCFRWCSCWLSWTWRFCFPPLEISQFEVVGQWQGTWGGNTDASVSCVLTHISFTATPHPNCRVYLQTAASALLEPRCRWTGDRHLSGKPKGATELC